MLNTVSESSLQEANLQQLVQEEVQKSIYRDEILEMDNLMLSGSEDPIIRGLNVKWELQLPSIPQPGQHGI